MMSAVASGRALDDPDRATLMNGDYSVRSDREMEELFIYAPRAYENTAKIASMIDLHIDSGGYKIPVFPLSEDELVRYEEYKKEVQNKNVSVIPDLSWDPAQSENTESRSLPSTREG